MFQFLEQARKNNNNPVELFNQITQNYTPEQKEKLFNQARQFGVPDEVINGINTKV
jgi:LysM repeat protein